MCAIVSCPNKMGLENDVFLRDNPMSLKVYQFLHLVVMEPCINSQGLGRRIIPASSSCYV